MEELELPTWVPVPPPPPSNRWEAALHWLKRNGFIIAVVLIVIGLGGLFFWMANPQEFSLDALFGGSSDPQQEAAGMGGLPADSSADASFSVLSNPVGATVMVDFDSIGATPVRTRVPRSGVYLITLRKPNYATLDTVIFIEKGQSLTFNFAMTRMQGSQGEAEALAGLPDEASGDAPETPPQPRASSPPTSDEGREQARETTPSSQPTQTPSPPQERRPDPSPRTGTLVVASQPRGATVQVNGRTVGTTPMTLTGVQTGVHDVELSLKDHTTYRTEVEVSPQQTQTVYGTLDMLTGTLTVLVKPWGSIYIDGELHRRDTDVQYQTKLPVGSHQIRVVHPSLGAWEQTLHISEDISPRIVVDLNRSESDEPTAQRRDGNRRR